MRLEDLSKPESYDEMERHINQPKYSAFAQYSEAQEQYNPRTGVDTIQVPFKIRNDVRVITSFPDTKALDFILLDGIKVFTHPQFFEEKCDGSVKAIPTASTRTVHSRTQKLYLKLNFPARISRFNRRLKNSSVEHSLAISADLEESLNEAPKCFAYQPESIGVTTPEGYGCIIREQTPRPLISEERFLIPFFSLYSKDQSKPGEKPLLIQMIDLSKQNPADYFINKIVHPFIECWAWFAKERGLLLESHCQNTLLEVDKNFNPCRIVYRDFQSIMVDSSVRVIKNLHNNFKKHVIGGEQDPFTKQQEYSIVYDHFVASYVFPFFTNCLSENYGLQEEKINELIRAKFKELFSDWEIYFPKTVFSLEDKIFDDNSVRLVDTNEKPKYR